MQIQVVIPTDAVQLMTAEARSKAEMFACQNTVGGETQSFVYMLQKIHDMEQLGDTGTNAGKVLPRLMEIFERADILPSDAMGVSIGKLWNLYLRQQQLCQEHMQHVIQGTLRQHGIPVSAADLPDTAKFPIHAQFKLNPKQSLNFVHDALNELGHGKDQWVVFALLETENCGSRQVIGTFGTPYGLIDYALVDQFIVSLLPWCRDATGVQSNPAGTSAQPEVATTSQSHEAQEQNQL